MASSRRLPASYNVSTYGDSSRDYTDLSTWEADTDINLVSAAKGEVLECYTDSSSYTDNVELGDATTSGSYFRVIRPASGHKHDGTAATGVKFVAPSGERAVRINEGYSQIHDLIISSSQTYAPIYITGTYNAIIGCIIIFTGANNAVMANVHGYVINCIGYGPNSSYGFFYGMYAGTAFYNCTVVGCPIGFSGTGTAKNCCVCDCTTSFAGTWSKTTCYEGTDTVFVNQAGHDYHLDSTDSTCRGNGTDLSSDSHYAFDDDIDGDTRTTWDIGADEYQTSGSSGWGHKIIGLSLPGKIIGVARDTVAKVVGV